MDIEEGDALIAAKAAKASDEIIIVTANAQSVRFKVDLLRSASRQSGGVRGIKLEKDDEAVAMDVVVENADLLVISAYGYGKRTPLSAWRTSGRGIGGVTAMQLTRRNGLLVSARVVLPKQDLMVISKSGDILRTTVDSVARIGRSTQGVIIKRVETDDPIVAVTTFNGAQGNAATQMGLPIEAEEGDGGEPLQDTTLQMDLNAIPDDGATDADPEDEA